MWGKEKEYEVRRRNFSQGEGILANEKEGSAY